MLEWNVYYESFNDRKIKTFNIFKHAGFLDDCVKYAKKLHLRDDIPEEKKECLNLVKRSLMYYFWSKCEWEIILTSWPPSKQDFRDEKIDVYDQVLLNWPIFAEYIWQNRREFKKKK